MSRRARLDSGALVIAAFVAMVAALAAWFGLSVLATPSDMSARLARVARQTDMAEDLRRRSGGGGGYPIDAVCSSAASVGAATLRRSVQDAAATSGVQLGRLAIVPGVADEAMAGLTPINIQIEAMGRYDQAMLLMKGLAKARPRIFVDQSDLTSQVSSVAFKLSGHAYCSTFAHP